MAFALVQQKFKRYLVESGLAEDTVKSYGRDTASFLAWLAQRRADDSHWPRFTAEDVEAYKRYLTQNQEQSPASINRALQSLRKFDQFMLTILEHNHRPAGEVSLVEVPSPAAPEVLSKNQERLLLNAAAQRETAKGRRDRAIICLLLRTGIRIKELVQLHHADISLADRYARIGADPVRKLPLDGETCMALERYLAQCARSGTEMLFTGQRGSPLSVRAVQQILANWGQILGFPVSAKLLRNSYARALWRETGDIQLMCDRLGYKHMQTAVRHLMHEGNMK